MDFFSSYLTSPVLTPQHCYCVIGGKALQQYFPHDIESKDYDIDVYPSIECRVWLEKLAEAWQSWHPNGNFETKPDLIRFCNQTSNQTSSQASSECEADADLRIAKEKKWIESSPKLVNGLQVGSLKSLVRELLRMKREYKEKCRFDVATEEDHQKYRKIKQRLKIIRKKKGRARNGKRT